MVDERIPCVHQLCREEDGSRREVRRDGTYDDAGNPRWAHLNGSYYCRTSEHVRLSTTAEPDPAYLPLGDDTPPEWPPKHRGYGW